MHKLDKFEMDIMLEMLSEENCDMEILKKQLDVCVIEKKYTGVGFFINFKVPEYVERIMNKNPFRIGNIKAEIDGLRNGASFLLYVKDGALDMLEGYSYDEVWPREVKNYKIANV